MTGPGHPYQYVVLRAVPRVDRGECVNVGVVLYCQRAEVLACAWRVDAAKLRALSPEVDVEGLEASLVAVGNVCQGIATPGSPPPGPPGPRFGWLAAPRSTVLQPGSIHAGVTSDPAADLEALLAAYVW